MNNKSLLFTIISVLLLFLTSCNKPDGKVNSGQSTNGAEDTSIVNLIATPERFAGKFVRVTGVMALEFEGDAIYLSASDAERHITKNGIWVDVNYPKLGIPETKPSDPEQLKKVMVKVKSLESMNGKYVVIEGVFDMNSHGHLGLYSGSLNVERMPRLREVEKRPNSGPK